MTVLTTRRDVRGPETGSQVELPDDDPAWLDLVREARDATVFHHLAWARVVAGTYGYPSAVIADLDERGRVTAGLPVVRVRRLGGRALVSLPFADHCAPLARDEASLVRLAAGLAARGAREGTTVEVRGAVPSIAGWTNTTVGMLHVLDIGEGAEAVRRRFSETHRRRLRQAERSGLRVRFGRTGDEMEAFYRLHLLTRRRQGVPVQPRRFFDAIWQHLVAPGFGMVVLAETPSGRTAAGAVVLAASGTAMVKYQASDETCWELRPNHLCCWAAIRWASETGHRRFDFGRTELRHAGLQRWKAGWGGSVTPLTYGTTGRGEPSGGGRGLLGAALGHVIKRSPTVVCRALGDLLYRFAA